MMVPLEQIATVTMGKGPSQIQHAGGKRMIACRPTRRAARRAR
jgi:HAE1 family hydrophobic/amphiphilic exporter-1